MNTLITEITELLDNHSGHIAPSNNVSQACLGLLHEERAFPIIERLVKLTLSQEDAATDLTNFDPPQRLLSNQLLSHLAEKSDLHEYAAKWWSTDLWTRYTCIYF